MRADISSHSNDIIMKMTAEMFRNVSLEFFGLKTPRIVGVVPTELPTVEVKDTLVDFVFLLEDESYLHIEFQTTKKRDDLSRFLLYDARLYERDKRAIKTAVVYSGGIEYAKDNLSIGSISYSVENIYMKDYNGDRIYSELSDKIEAGEALSRIDQLRLIFLALMRSRDSEEEMAVRSIELAKRINVKETRVFTIGAILAVSDKFLSEEYKSKVLEVLEMTEIERMIREKGKIEGKMEGRMEGKMEEKKNDIVKLLEIRFPEDISPLLVNKVMAIYDIEKLNRVFEGAAKGSSIKDVEKLLN